MRFEWRPRVRFDCEPVWSREVGMKTVMVVDDDLATLELLGAVLSEAGFSPVLLPTSEGIPEKVADSQPDLILLDILIEPKHGMEVLESLSKMDGCPPVVLMSAAVKGIRDMGQIAKGLGCYDFVEKPFDVDEFLKVIEGAVQGARV